MRIYEPNGTSFWHYEFVLNGKRYHKSTKMTNERGSEGRERDIHRLGERRSGIGEPKPVPTLRAFREDFITAVQAEKQDKPKTAQFYTYSFDSLLKYEPFAETRLNRIDERLVQRFTVWALARTCGRNRSLISCSPGRTASVQFQLSH